MIYTETTHNLFQRLKYDSCMQCILDFSFDVKGIIVTNTGIWISSVDYNMCIVSLLISWFWSLYCGFNKWLFCLREMHTGVLKSKGICEKLKKDKTNVKCLYLGIRWLVFRNSLSFSYNFKVWNYVKVKNESGGKAF